MFVNYL